MIDPDWLQADHDRVIRENKQRAERKAILERSREHLLTKGSVMPEVVDAEPMMQFFGYAHLPPAMQAVSKPFGDLAQQIVSTVPRNPERTAALRKLLEAKDCAVRATIYKL